MIDVIVLKVGLGPEHKLIEPTLAAMQSMVGGYLEQVHLAFLPPGVIAYVDEDGRRKELKPNRWGLLGTIVLVRMHGSHEVNLTTDDISAIKRLTKGTAN